MPTTTAEDAYLLEMAGVTTPEPEATKTKKAKAKAAPTVTVEVEGLGDEHAAALADILAKSKGVRVTGETLVDEYIDALWTRTKMNKIEAARAGLESASAHNVPAWKVVQAVRGRMKDGVRKYSREQAHVATKIADKGHTPKRTPEVDAFLLKHADDPTARALAELLGL